MTGPDLFALGALAVVGFAAISIFNRLVALNRRCDQASADIDVQLKQRCDLIPSLVETVKGYAGHERGTLEAVMKARSMSMQAASPTAQMQADAQMGAALGRLFAVAENYPDLKASANFSDLQAEISDVENKIAASRRYLNSAITEYNTTREQFPANLMASVMGFTGREAMIAQATERARLDTAPAVRF